MNISDILEIELKRCRLWIEEALNYSGGTHDFDDIVAGVAAGKMQLWPADNSCIVTEIVRYPKCRTLHIFLAGGNMQEITGMHDDVIAWAKGQGCVALTMTGRFGWEKALKKHGWEREHITLKKEF